MSYTSIYREYRPTTFDQLVGQEHIVKVLRNQVKNSRVGHAYLFTGTRGTGKTSVARMFAKAINCLTNINGSPCGKCEVCKQLNLPSSLDIIEIDAASNNGVDDIRELRENVKYPPVLAKYKVYIIDEVHMLSAGAFDALLKTLEEPPPHVIFILATTEVHKIPQTILSRCLRFDFRLLPSFQVAERIKYIFKDLNVEYTDEAVLAIAEAGDGSMRDSLSIADMCISYGNSKITYDDVLDVLGASNPSSVVDIIRLIFNGDIMGAFKLINEISNLGKSITLLAKDIAKMLRNLYIAKNCDSPLELLTIPNDIVEKLCYLQPYSNERTLQTIDIMCGIENSMRYSALPRVLLEAAIAKAGDPKAILDINGINQRLKMLEKTMASGKIIAKPMESEDGAKAQDELPKEFNEGEFLGYMIKALRERKLYSLYAQVSGFNKDAIRLSDGILFICTDTINEAKNLEIPQYLNELKEIASSGYPQIKEVKIKCSQIKTDLTGDIDLVKSMFDKSIVTINNKGGK